LTALANVEVLEYTSNCRERRAACFWTTLREALKIAATSRSRFPDMMGLDLAVVPRRAYSVIAGVCMEL